MYYQDADFTVVDRVVELAARRGVKPAQIALAWMLHKPAIASPIIGVTKLDQLEELAAATAIKLSADEVAHLESAYVPHPVLGH
jgi:aryl-alcohol dehydrogenase (NADP+)